MGVTVFYQCEIVEVSYELGCVAIEHFLVLFVVKKMSPMVASDCCELCFDKIDSCWSAVIFSCLGTYVVVNGIY